MSALDDLDKELLKWEHLQQSTEKSYDAARHTLDTDIERFDPESLAEERDMAYQPMKEGMGATTAAATTDTAIMADSLASPATTQFEKSSFSSSSSSSTGPSNTKGGLSMTAKVAIGLCVALVVAVGIFLAVYFTVIRKSKNPVDKFGTVSVFDDTNGSSGPFHTGDTIVLTYVAPATIADIITPGTWKMSLDNGDTFAYDIPSIDTAGSNFTTYVIPVHTYSNDVVFRVYDATDSSKYATSTAYAIVPRFSIISGPGTIPGQVIYDAVDITTGLSYNAKTISFVQADFRVQLSTSSGFSSTTDQTVTAFDNTAQTLTWRLNSSVPASTTMYLRVIANGMTSGDNPTSEQLSAVAPQSIGIDTIACSTTSDTFNICTVTMYNDDGTSGRFFAGTPVTLAFSFNGTFGGTATWTYNLGDGGADIAITPSAGPTTTGSIVTYSWTIPAGISSNLFYITATSESSTVNSKTFIVEHLSMKWDSPYGGITIGVFPGENNAGAQQLNIVQTLVTLSIPYDPTTMKFYIGLTNTVSDTPSYFEPYFTGPPSSTLSDNLAVLQWSVTQAQIGNGGNAQKVWWLKLVDGEKTVINNTGSTSKVQFKAEPWAVQIRTINNLYNLDFCFNGITNGSFDGVPVTNAITPLWTRNVQPTPPAPNPWPIPYTGPQDKFYCNLQSDGTQSIIRSSTSDPVALAWTYTPKDQFSTAEPVATLTAYNSNNENQRLNIITSRPITTGLTQGGSHATGSSSIVLDAASQQPTNNYYANLLLTFISGPGSDTGNLYTISSYVSATNTITVDADIGFTPTVTTGYNILFPGTIISHVVGGQMVIPWVERCAPTTPYFSGNFDSNLFPGQSTCSQNDPPASNNGLGNYRFTILQAYQV